MKKVISIFLALSAVLPGLLAANPVERVFVSTDREVYIAGDEVWCSLFCLDPEGRPSPSSAVSYLELISLEGTVSEAKVGLLDGRGAGSIRIPVSAPTGIYRLVAYTAANTNEDGQPWIAGSRILTVFNTASTARVKDGVEIVEDKEYEAKARQGAPEAGSLVFNSGAFARAGADVSVLVQNNGPAADISFSVYHEDAVVPAPQENPITGFIGSLPSSANARFTGNRPVEYDGEIITAKVKGIDPAAERTTMATLSSAGAPSNIYIGIIDGDKVRFMTGNIYGDREIVCEVTAPDESRASVDFDTPFIYPEAGSLPKLPLARSLYGDLAARKSAARAWNQVTLDTLATFMRHREDLLLESLPVKRYHLDDYNRFSTVNEIIIEFVRELGLHKENGKYVMKVRLSDGSDSVHEKFGNILVMMDGVILSDLTPLVEFDAMLLKDIDIYQSAVVCGNVSYSGAVNFITKKNYVTAINFPPNVKVVDFKGISYPVAYYGSVPEGTRNDSRQVLYWDPSLRIEAGGQARLTFRAPGYSGRFRAVATGVAADGSPISHEWTFEVE